MKLEYNRTEAGFLAFPIHMIKSTLLKDTRVMHEVIMFRLQNKIISTQNNRHRSEINIVYFNPQLPYDSHCPAAQDVCAYRNTSGFYHREEYAFTNSFI